MNKVTPARALLLTLLAIHTPAGASHAQPDPSPQQAQPAITLDRIMADPDWIARSPENPYFLDDSKTLYWRQQDEGSDERSLYMTRLAGPLDGQPAAHEKVPLEQVYRAELRGGDTSPDGLYRVTSRAGDIFLISRRSGDITQITSTSDNENSPRFVYDVSSRPRRIMYTRAGLWYSRDLDTGTERDAGRTVGLVHAVGDVRRHEAFGRLLARETGGGIGGALHGVEVRQCERHACALEQASSLQAPGFGRHDRSLAWGGAARNTSLLQIDTMMSRMPRSFFFASSTITWTAKRSW